MNRTTAVTSAVKAACPRAAAMEAATTPASESVVGNEADGKQDNDRKGSQKITKHGISSVDCDAAAGPRWAPDDKVGYRSEFALDLNQ